MLSSRNFPTLPTYAFAHAKTKTHNFDYSILELDSDIGIIFHVFKYFLFLALPIINYLSAVKNRKNPGIQPRYGLLSDMATVPFFIFAFSLHFRLKWFMKYLMLCMRFLRSLAWKVYRPSALTLFDLITWSRDLIRIYQKVIFDLDDHWKVN